MAARRYSIVLADRTSGVVRRGTVPLWPALTGAAMLFALPVLVGLGARWSAQAAIADLNRSNTALQMENSSYRQATAQLTTQLTSLQTAVDALGTQAAVDPAASRAMDRLPAVVRSRAMGGGGSALLPPALGGALSAPDTTFGALRELLTVLEDRLDIVRNGVERRQALAAATPSIWPVVGWLSSPFGTRRDPFTGGRDFHPGLDISADAGVPVHAPADGVVASAAPNGNYGNLIVLDHGYGITTRFGHLSKFAARAGDPVRRGEVIGYVGSTGRSTSAHLHYEILLNGQLTNPLKLLAGR
ncbi:MAG: M23 family metallopeptidase [Acidobacteriota bacterium]|nr:M23 family metallopeptidase [Acidobacteriota bacterium]